MMQGRCWLLPGLAFPPFLPSPPRGAFERVFSFPPFFELRPDRREKHDCSLIPPFPLFPGDRAQTIDEGAYQFSFFFHDWAGAPVEKRMKRLPFLFPPLPPPPGPKIDDSNFFPPFFRPGFHR